MKESIVALMILLLCSCSNKEKFECPCGGYVIVAHGTMIEIELLVPS